MKYYFLVFLFVIISCTNRNNENVNVFQKSNQKVIVIQPLGSFKAEEAKKVFVEIKTINPNVVLRSSISFPEN
nr:hypothetical protein [Flavobacterium sp. ASV13]